MFVFKSPEKLLTEASQSTFCNHGCLGLDLARYPILVLRCSLTVPDYTLMTVYQVIAWSLQVSCPPCFVDCTKKCVFLNFEGVQTVNTISLMLWSSLQVLASGVHPSTDFEGNPLPDAHKKLAGKPIAGAFGQTYLKCYTKLFWIFVWEQLSPTAQTPLPASQDLTRPVP